MRAILLVAKCFLLVATAPGAEIATAPATSPSPHPAITRAVNTLLGKWDVVLIGTMKMPADLALAWKFEDGHIVVTNRNGEQVSRNPYTVDTAVEPIQLRMSIEGEKDCIGWIRVIDGDLEILLSVDTGEPPKSWQDGSVMRLQRADK